MLDYSTILDNKTKKHILLTLLENQRNIISQYIEEHSGPDEIEATISKMEDLQQALDEIIKNNFDEKNLA